MTTKTYTKPEELRGAIPSRKEAFDRNMGELKEAIANGDARLDQCLRCYDSLRDYWNLRAEARDIDPLQDASATYERMLMILIEEYERTPNMASALAVAALIRRLMQIRSIEDIPPLDEEWG